MTPPPDGPEGPPVADDDSPREEAEVPESGIEVEAHLHFGMTGTFPLRLGDLFFADDGLYIAEYSYVTPFIGLTARKHRRDSRAMGALYDRYGLDAVLVEADTVVWHSYDNVDRIVVHTGGWLGRPKVTVYPEAGPTHAYRFHDRPSFEEGVADLEPIARGEGFRLERRDRLGFAPLESLRRFFWKP